MKLSGLMRTAVAIVWLTPLCGATGEDSVHFFSGPAQLPLLELYTSQGCSSCPPAERWLNRYVDDADLWTRIVPVAFHVDYWDALGWMDPYAAAEHGTRQRAYARAGRTGGVYTPGLFVNGREWRGWIFALPPRASDREPGTLEVRVTRDRVDAAFPAHGRTLDLHLARLGFGIETRVLRGENGNRVLPQEFVVLAHAVYPANDGRWHVPLPRASNGAVRREAVAVWVSEAGDPAPLQATGGWLPAALLE